jgi:cytochrome b561
MKETETYALYPWHKSFGVLIAFFVIWRIYWRMKNGWPAPVRDYPSLEKVLSKLTHYILIIGTLLMPISGFLMSAVGGHGVDFFGMELVARNPAPTDPAEVIAHNGAVAGSAHTLHEVAGYLIVLALLLHIAGAFKHHIVDKDGTLRRMLGDQV